MRSFFSRHLKTMVIALSALMFLVALPMPAIQFVGGNTPPAGTFFFVGWLGPVAGHIEWYANVFLLLAMVRVHQRRSVGAVFMASIALLLMFATPLRGCIVADEGGVCQAVAAYRIGWWLWLASAVTLALGAFADNILLVRARRHGKPHGW